MPYLRQLDILNGSRSNTTDEGRFFVRGKNIRRVTIAVDETRFGSVSGQSMTTDEAG